MFQLKPTAFNILQYDPNPDSFVNIDKICPYSHARFAISLKDLGQAYLAIFIDY